MKQIKINVKFDNINSPLAVGKIILKALNDRGDFWK